MKDLTTYEQAKALKELGFNEPCFGYHIEKGKLIPASYSDPSGLSPDSDDGYPSNSDLLPGWVSALTYSQAFRWFREKNNMTQTVARDGSLVKNGPWAYTILNDCIIFNDGYVTYEEAESACLDKLIEIVKSQITTS